MQFLSMLKNIRDFLSVFRNILMMSSGYAISVTSTMVMYTLLPVIYSRLWDPSVAGLLIMSMTILQVFVAGPISASLLSKYGSKKVLFIYAWSFFVWSLFRLLSYMVDSVLLQKLLVIIMTICFAAGFGAKFVDIYTLRMSPLGKSGLSFGFLITFAGLGRFLWTILQPFFLNPITQFGAPIVMMAAMLIFGLALWYSETDTNIVTRVITNRRHISHHVWSSIKDLLISYKNIFRNGWLFIQHCKSYPLIPLSLSFFDGVFFWSLWFVIPLYLAQNPQYISQGLEIGIYEMMSLCFAVICGYIADKYNTTISAFIWWIGVLIGVIILYHHPRIEMLVFVWVIIWISNNLLYAVGQKILTDHDEDHPNDGAYGQTKNMISNIWYMFMPVVWWLLEFISFDRLLQLFASLLSIVVMLGIIITFYVLIMKRHTRTPRYKHHTAMKL